MAQRKITNISSGIYFNEIDLTVVQQNAGTFAGACIGLTEKGPAFESMGFASFEERALRMGDVNPDFKTSYYAREFLAQASNYKEVRVLGLEGYNEDPKLDESGNNIGGYNKAFVVLYDQGAVAPATTPLIISDVEIDGGAVKVTVFTTVAPVEGKSIIVSDVQGIKELTPDEQTLGGQYFVAGPITPEVGDKYSFYLAKYVDNVLTNITGEITGSGYVSGTGTITSVSPVIAAPETIACILKPRRGGSGSTPGGFTGYPEIDYVTLNKVTMPDSSLAATDELFSLSIYYRGNQNVYPPMEAIKCSLREDSPNYIGNVFGTDPRDNTKVLGQTSPLWVDFVYQSKKAIPDISGTYGYYYPGEDDYDPQAQVPGALPTPHTSLDLMIGNITVKKDFAYPSVHVDGVSTTPGNIRVTTATAHGYTAGELITLEGMEDITVPGSDGAQVSLDGNWYVAASPAPDATSFTIVDSEGNAPVTTGSFVVKSDALTRKAFVATWETEVMDLGGGDNAIEFQTPLTPWFVSDFDDNGIVKRLFRLWSISDGESANTEIKIEVSNINPDGNNGKGSFDIYVRDFNDTEDKGRRVYEGFANLTMDPKSTNYILRRIGDGDRFPLNSSFIFVELNEDDVFPDNSLPYGAEGLPNTYLISTPNVNPSTQYDLSKSVSKQILGLSNNDINTFREVIKDNLSFKNIISKDSVGKGFHLNPKYLTGQPDTSVAGKGGWSDPILYSKLTSEAGAPGFKLVDHRSYNTSITNTTKVSGLTKVARSKYVVCMFGGFDAWNVYAQRTWDDVTSKDREALDRAIEVLSDNENLLCDFSVLATPDINFQNYPSASSAVLEMVVNRGDALYLFDFDYGYDTGIRPTINANDAKIALDASEMKSSFGACYYPDVQLTDDRNNINPWLPASIVALATIASVATNENVWQPPAGSLRTVTQNLIRTRKRMKINDREILKSASINPITEFPGSGFEITESRTTQPVFSALSFIHNRLLLGYAKKALNQVLRPLLHQLKNENLRDAFLNAVRPIFARIKRLNGLEEFDVIATGLSEDRTTLHGRIIITPLYPVEKIIVDFVLKDGNIDYNNQ